MVAHNSYRDRVQNHLATDPKAFWNYVRAKKANSDQYRLIRNGKDLSHKECAEEFARFFHSVYNPQSAVLDAMAASTTATPSGAQAHLDLLDAATVRSALARLPPKRSMGPDGIPPYVLRDCRMVLFEPLLHLFNNCISAATFPERWKLTRVVPVPKGRGGTDASDYRPVAVLSSPAKVFEAAIQRSLYDQVKAYLSTAQHGFCPGRSTTGNLLQLMTTLVPAVDAGLQVDVAYFDFRKAFDTVDNDILLLKLAGKGFTPQTLRFFASYLRDRRQFVDCGGQLSEPYYTRSGVSQGSNLGPLLFILMIDDLPEVLKGSSCLLFADDLKLFHVVKDITDHNTLQDDINKVIKWSKDNKLYFNVSKCSVVSFTRRRSPRHHLYEIEGEPLNRAIEVRDLGICFSSDLNFKKHILNTCNKAYRNLGFVLRQANDFNNIRALKALYSLYDALVRSHLEFKSVIWGPSEDKYKLIIERIQNKFCRFIYFKLYKVYPGYPLLYPTLFVLGMVGYFKLETRREVALVTYLFKVFRGLMFNPDILSEIRICVPDGYTGRRRRPQLLVVPSARTNLLQRAPLTRALRTLNTVADRVDLFTCSLNDFIIASYNVISFSSEK